MAEGPAFAAALVSATVLTPVAAAWGRRIGLVDRPGDDELKIHVRDIPNTGGLAILASFWIGLSFGDRLGWPLAVAVACLCIGLVDDVVQLPAWGRVLALAAAGGALAFGVETELTPMLWLWAGFQTTVLANAVNLIDGQDGLAAGLGAVAALGLAWLGAGALGLVLAGALIGFLLWNRPPARCFMGNSGAYGVGGILSALALEVEVETGWPGFVAAGACLAPFLFELGSTAVRRSRARPASGLAGGDRSHSYDVLSSQLGSRGVATLTFWLLGATCAALARVAAVSPAPVHAALVASGIAVTVLFGLRGGKELGARSTRH